MIFIDFPVISKNRKGAQLLSIASYVDRMVEINCYKNTCFSIENALISLEQNQSNPIQIFICAK